eukprot:Seg48.11 transcript_id=Seg48.11/GoldUCD/mRNA.D3Y31 product="Protein RMD5 A" protein_id=Seg48.11/GoldUCD/D3Y31
MDACNGVERELDKLLGRFSTFKDSLEKLDELIQHVQTTKNGLLEAPPETLLSPLQAHIVAACGKKVKDGTQKVAIEHKELHSCVSKVGKAVDRNFVSDFSGTTQEGIFSGNEAVLLNEAISEHLLRQGHVDVANMLIQEANLTLNEKQKEPFFELNRILDECKSHNLEPALRWVQSKREELIEKSSPLEFKLHRLKFIDLIKEGRCKEALEYSKNFSRFRENMKEIQRLMGCFAFMRVGLENSPYSDLLDPVNWLEINDILAKDACSLLGLSISSPLEVSVTTGCVALPTLLQIKQVMKQRQCTGVWSSKEELPVEIDLGNEYRFHSIFACPILRQQCGRTNPPMRLVCGHAISKDALNKLVTGNKMLKSLALIYSIIGLTCVVTVKCKKDPKDSRQAIPLALVQADTLASAKHPPNTDKANGTTNGTALANNNTNNNTILHKLINLYNPSVSANIPQAVWRVDHQTNSNYGVENEAIVGNDNSGTTNDDDPFEEFTRCNHSQEILVGPLNSLPEHPNGNGPQDMKLKATGINKRDIESTKNQNPSSKTIKRFKREFEIDDDDDDDDLGGNDKAETIIVRLKDDRNQHERSRRSKTSKKSLKSKKSSKRDGIGLPYVPNRERFMPPGASRLPYDEEEIMEDEMSRIPSSQPVGMASSPEPSNYGPYEDAPRTANEPAQEFESPAPDPLRLQESYERSSTWEPIGAQARFSQQEEYNDGLPDRNYDRTLESDAQSLDDRLVQNFFNREKGRQGYDQSYDQQDPNKRSEEEKYSLLDSLGIGESEIDHKYLSEAKSIQDYLTKSEIRSVGQSLGHNTRQHNNIQVGSSPEMMQERPNFWNMIDSASYTPMSNEAETLMPNEQRDNDGQVLQSQNSMGRVFVPLNMENLAQNVQNEISKHYKVPNRMRQNGMMDPDKAVPNYPNIVKSFYPNIPYQTVSGASLNPPDINSPNYRSFIQQPYAQQQQQLYPQQFMQTPQAPFQPVPLMLPFAGMPNPQYQNMLGNRQPFMGPMQMPAMGRSFPMGMPSDMPGNNQDADFPGHETRSFEEEAKPKGPGMLTVSSSDNGDDVAQQQSKASDFEGLSLSFLLTKSFN